MSTEALLIPRAVKVGEFDADAAADLAARFSEIEWADVSTKIDVTSCDASFDVEDFDPAITIEPVGTEENHATTWHVDTINDTIPTGVHIGATLFVPEIIYGVLKVEKDVAQTGNAGFLKFLHTEQGQAAIEDGIKSGDLAIETEILPGDIARVTKLNAHRRKRAANNVPRFVFKDIIWEF